MKGMRVETANIYPIRTLCERVACKNDVVRNRFNYQTVQAFRFDNGSDCREDEEFKFLAYNFRFW